MDWKPIILDLCMKEMCLDAIHVDLVLTFKQQAMTRPTATTSAGRVNFVSEKDAPCHRPAAVESSVVDTSPAMMRLASSIHEAAAPHSLLSLDNSASAMRSSLVDRQAQADLGHLARELLRFRSMKGGHQEHGILKSDES
jgi:hypothetical protein